jgi:hypothetical protein
MAFAVFNVANRDTRIKARSASLRILGVGLDFNEANRIADGVNVECRIWDLSTPEKIQWRVISNTNLGVTYDTSATILAEEYASIPLRLLEWDQYRNSEIYDTLSAAQSGKKRSSCEVRAASLLESLTEIRSSPIASPSSPSSKAPTAPQVKRDQEIRGQSWAIIAVVGDSKYETSKHLLLQKLGRAYFSAMNASLINSQLDPTNPEHEDEIQSTFIAQFGPEEIPNLDILSVHHELASLVEEPMFAIFEASDDPDALVKKAEVLSKLPQLKNASIAVVRMYSWLRLRMIEHPKIAHASRDPAASTFFQAMRSAMV